MLTCVKKTVKELCRCCGLDVRRTLPYGPFEWLRDWDIRTVLDVGANTGQFARRIHRALPEARIYSFEPLSECYEQLKSAVDGESGFQAFNFALGQTNGQTQMYHNEASACSSLLPLAELHKEAFPSRTQVHVETIQVRRLDDVAPDLQIVDNLLIKVDVQGTEDKVIAGGEETFARAAVLILETSFVPLYEGQVLFDAIYERLRQMGFSYMGTEQIIRHPQTGRVLQCDSLFFRQDKRPLAQ